MIDLAFVIKRIVSGSHITRRRYLRWASQISKAIYERFGLQSVNQLKPKHLRWFLDQATLSPSALYNYWRTVETIVDALDRADDWLPHLKGPWCRTGVGGRPPRRANTMRDDD